MFSYCLTSQSAYWNRKGSFIFTEVYPSGGGPRVPIRRGFYSIWDSKPGYYVACVQTRGSERNPNGSWLLDELGSWRWINYPLVLPHSFSPIAMRQPPEHRFLSMTCKLKQAIKTKVDQMSKLQAIWQLLVSVYLYTFLRHHSCRQNQRSRWRSSQIVWFRPTESHPDHGNAECSWSWWLCWRIWFHFSW